MSCTAGEAGCTTVYDVSDGTYCFDAGDSTHCHELCDRAAAPCASDHRCFPRAFEPGGLCSFTESAIPDDG